MSNPESDPVAPGGRPPARFRDSNFRFRISLEFRYSIFDIVLPFLAVTCLLPSAPAFADDEAAPAPGLIAVYTDGARRVTTVVPTPHFTLGPDESVHPQIGPAFTAEWSGVLRVLRRGTYTIRGAARVDVAGHADAAGSPLELAAGDHPVRIAYRRPEGAARFQLEWESKEFKPEPMPASAFAHGALPPEAAAQARVERGRDLAERLHCVGCHRSGKPGLPPLGPPELTHVGSRARAGWIFRWLEDPQTFRPGTAMPAMLPDAQERADVAAYLAARKAPAEPPALAADAGRAARGRELFRKVGCLACHDDPSAADEAAAAPGDRVPVKGMGSKTTAPALAAYLLDPLAVNPFGRMPSMMLAKDEAEALAEFLVQFRAPGFDAEAPAGDPARGKQLVVTRGCLTCHLLKDDAESVHDDATLAAPWFEALTRPEAAARGCLADAPGGKAPRYALSAEDRANLRAFVAAPAAAAAAPAHEFRRTVRALRCTSCHALDGSSPSSELTELPPPLTGAGDKLRPSWIAAVLLQKKRIRPWMGLRMPHFSELHMAGLAPLLAAAAGTDPAEPPTPPAPALDTVAAGIKAIGRGGGHFNCVGCHDFRGVASSGTRGPDMTEMTARLRPEWFRRWLRDPSRLQPGTAMPSFFADKPDAEVEPAIDLLWATLAGGGGLPLPSGIGGTESLNLQVISEPLVFRTFMPESSPRSLAVGLPGHLSYCFDAQVVRFRYAWFGDFIDASPTWTGRGGNPAKPLGRRIYTAPDVPPLRIGDPDRLPAMKFQGYELGADAPVLEYEADGVSVRERIVAPAEGLGLVRSFLIGPVEKPVWFVVGPEQPGVTVTGSSGEWVGRSIKFTGTPAGLKFEISIRIDGTK